MKHRENRPNRSIADVNRELSESRLRFDRELQDMQDSQLYEQRKAELRASLVVTGCLILAALGLLWSIFGEAISDYFTF
jgi:hypothetical protein